MEQAQKFETPENKNVSFEEFILLLLSRKKLILSSFFIALIAAIIFTSPAFLPPEFKSETIFYPPSNYSGKLMFDNNLYFGVDKEVDEEIQILKSSILRDSLIAKYKLMMHYGIDAANKYKLNELYEKLNSCIKIERTRYNSISVIVYDTDPALAANMANDMVKIGDEVKLLILKHNLKISYASTEKENLKQLKKLDSLAKQINSIDGSLFKSKSFTAFESDKLDLLKEQIDIRGMIKDAVENKNKILTDMLYDYETKFNQFIDIKESLRDINKKLNSENINSFIITPAEPADKKSFPIRSLIIILVGICDLLITISAVLILEKYKEIRIKSIK